MAIATRPITNDDAPVRIRSNRLHRPLLMAAYALHFISSAIVLSIAVYFLSKIKEVFDRDNHTHGLILYWTIVAAGASLCYLIALLLPAIKSYKGYLAPLTFIFSILWLTAFILATREFRHLSCQSEPSEAVKICAMMKILWAFIFIAFFTCVISTLLESRLWYIQRYKHVHYADTCDVDEYHTNTFDTDKNHAGAQAVTTSDAHPTTSTV